MKYIYGISPSESGAKVCCRSSSFLPCFRDSGTDPVLWFWFGLLVFKGFYIPNPMEICKVWRIRIFQTIIYVSDCIEFFLRIGSGSLLISKVGSGYGFILKSRIRILVKPTPIHNPAGCNTNFSVSSRKSGWNTFRVIVWMKIIHLPSGAQSGYSPMNSFYRDKKNRRQIMI